MPVVVEDYGTTCSGLCVKRWTLSNKNGAILQVLNYGATISAFKIPSPKDNTILTDVVLGYPDLKTYEKAPFYLGSLHSGEGG